MYEINEVIIVTQIFFFKKTFPSQKLNFKRMKLKRDRFYAFRKLKDIKGTFIAEDKYDDTISKNIIEAATKELGQRLL